MLFCVYEFDKKSNGYAEFPLKIGSIFHVKEPHYTVSKQETRIVSIQDCSSLKVEAEN